MEELHRFWNEVLGGYQHVTGDTNYLFIGATASARRKLASGVSHINANDSKISIVEFPDVRTTLASGGLSSIGVWIRTYSFDECHTPLLTIVRCIVKRVCLYFWRVASDKSQQAICSVVARLLREEREKRGLSMNLVAERSGLSQQMVSYVEREMRNPTLETLLRIAGGIEIDLVEVLSKATKEVRKAAPRRKSDRQS